MQPLVTSWLARCCEGLPAGPTVSQAALFLGPGAATASWPDPDDEAGDELAAAAVAAIAARRTITRPREKNAEGETTGRVLGFAIPLGARRVAAVALIVEDEAGGETVAGWTEQATQAIESAGTWLPIFLGAEGGGGAQAAERLVHLAATLLESDSASAANVALVSEIATMFAADRASLGFLDDRTVRLDAVSHSARFDVRTRLGRAIGEAMEEAIDAEQCVFWPNAEPTAPDRCHRLLGENHEIGTIVTVPLSAHGTAIGALTVEYRTRHPAPQGVAERLERMGALLGPLLWLRRQDARPTTRKIRDAAQERLRAWSGPERRIQRAAIAAAAIAVLVLAVVPGTERVSAPARLEGLIQRAVVAPIDGYVAESRARAGDVVRRGDVLGRLDDTELLAERRKWSARTAQLGKEYRAAIAGRDRAEARIASARLAQAKAELELVEQRLARTRLVAPFDGVVAEGDLSRALGSPTERGQVLFQVAPLDRYRIVLEVPETEIAGIDVGQKGQLKLSARPGEALPLEVDRIVPIAVSEEGRNFFRVEAVLAEQVDALRPGMEGVGKIEVGRRSLLFIHTHEIVDWLRLNLWAYLP